MKKKVLLDLDEEVVECLDLLKDRLGVNSRSTVVSMLIETTKEFAPAKAKLINIYAANIAPLSTSEV